VSGLFTPKPVILKKSGYIFDENIIKSYIKIYKRCPITGIACTYNDLINCKISNNFVNITPSKVNILSSLDTIKKEINNLLIELFHLRYNLIFSRQELVNVYFQNDYVCKILIKLLKQKNLYKKTINSLKWLLRK